MWRRYRSTAGQLTITDSTVSGNIVDLGSGGGIYNSGTLTIANSTISGNTASSNAIVADGGGIYNDLSATLTITNSTFSGNQPPTASGGGIILATAGRSRSGIPS